MFTWVVNLLFNKNDTTLIGLTKLREAKEPAQECCKIQKSKELRISDLMRGESL